MALILLDKKAWADGRSGEETPGCRVYALEVKDGRENGGDGMEVSRRRESGGDVEEARCAVCGVSLTAGTLCKACKEEGLSTLRYAELFWDEV